MTPAESLTSRATSLGLYGLLAHLSDVASQPWVETLLEWEESERACRGLARRIQAAHIGRFRPMADFGVPALFTTASALLADLSERHTSYALQQRLRHYSRPKLLCIDEIGYLSYDARAADLLFEVITRRYQRASTIVSTNKAFSEWHEIFPNATSVVTLIDRLTHQAEVLSIEGESYRLKESRERAEKKQQSRRSQRKKSSST